MNLKDTIKSIISDQDEYFFRYPNVMGVGCGNKYINNINTGKLCIQVYVKKKWPKGCKITGCIPPYYSGIPTDVIEFGKFSINNKPSGSIPIYNQNGLYVKIRPVKMGYVIAPYGNSYPGSAGCIVTRKDPETGLIRFYILGSNLTMAYLNSIPIGTPILQPPSIFKTEIIAGLSEFVPLNFIVSESKPINYVNAAIAEITDISLVTPEIAFMGIPKGVDRNPKQDSLVRKSGPASGYTAGRIISESATIDIQYGTRTLHFIDQIIADEMSFFGDTGSVVLNKNDQVVGMVNSGTTKDLTVISKISYVENLLNVSVYTQE